MGVKLNRGEKILSIVHSGLGIVVLLLTHAFIPEWFNYAVIFAIVLITLTIVGLAVKIAAQSKKIHVLEGRNRISEERITKLERLANVPFFKKWNLFYTFIWRNSIPFLNNPINLSEIHVVRKLDGTGRTKDNHVTYTLSGTCTDKTNSFKFCIAGASNISLGKINFQVMDLLLNQELEYSVLRYTQDLNIKYLEIFFRKQMSPKDGFKIELSWQWPKTAVAKSDYFSIPNIYSITTNRIILDLFPTPDMNLSSVETYKFGLSDIDPVLIEHVYKNGDGFYRSVIDNPEKDADYITYYG